MGLSHLVKSKYKHGAQDDLFNLFHKESDNSTKFNAFNVYTA